MLDPLLIRGATSARPCGTPSRLGGGRGRRGGEGAPPRPRALGVPLAPDRSSPSRRGRAGARSAIFATEDFYADLRRRYRDAFERLEREGRIEEAAFVLAELLRESEEAVAFLERHGRLRLAAEIAEARALPPAVLVRQWFLAGEVARAVLLARRHGAFADALARLERTGHPEAPALRLLWAETLAEAGDFGAAVAVAWEIPSARHLAEAWIDAAIAQGGRAAAALLGEEARALPRRLPRDPRASSRCSSTTTHPARRSSAARWPTRSSKGPDRPPPRRSRGPSSARSPATPAPRALACPTASPPSSPYSSATTPSAPTSPTSPSAIPCLSPGAGRAASRSHPPTPAPPRCTTPSTMPDGRTLLALGEAGVRVLSRSGKVAFQLDQPAHHLVVSDRGDRALALARRGGALRVARLDLAGRRSQVWCEARLDAWARDFDGSQWVVSTPGAILAVDALDARFEALASFAVDAPVEAIARSPTACVVATADRRLRYELPSWTLRGSPRAASPEGHWLPMRAHHGDAVSATGTHARFVASHGQAPNALALAHWTDATQLRVVVLADEGLPLALAAGAGWVASAVRISDGVRVCLHDDPTLTRRAEIDLDGAGRVAIRLSDDALTVADDRGRVLVVELTLGDLVRDARV